MKRSDSARLLGGLAGALALTLSASPALAAPAPVPLGGLPSSAAQTAPTQAADTVRVWFGAGPRDYVDVPVHNTETFAAAPALAPTWLPEGWGLDRIRLGDDTNTSCRWSYRLGAGGLEFRCTQSAGGRSLVAGLTAADRQSVTVGGAAADYCAKDGYTYLFWTGASGERMELRSGPYLSPSKEELVRIAESVKALDPVPAYGLGWMPSGARSVDRQTVPGGGWEELVDGQGWCFTLTYAAEDAGAPSVSGQAPQAVTVGGAAGTYYAPARARSTPFATRLVTTADGGQEVRYTAGGGETATLVWTKDGVTFRLQGALDRETLLRMAESVTAAQPWTSSPAETAGEKG